MKKIGVVTWYFGANYGAMAQSIALCGAVKKLGYECTLVNYRPQGYLKTIVRANIPPKWRRLLHLRKTVDGIKKVACLSRNSLLSETPKVHNARQIDELGLDGLIFGSDAIFNTRHRLCEPIYFGVDITTPKVTYSPSCEYLNPRTVLPDSYKQSLTEMSAMSVRDINTLKLVKNNTGIQALITLDPTFLYEFDEILPQFKVSQYILIYSFSDWSVHKDRIVEYAKKNDMSIVDVGQRLPWADYSYPTATFEQWVDSFRNASLVITDSFHGTVFSLKNRKQIILCGRGDKKSKIQALMSQLGITIKLYQGEMLSKYLSENFIDYTIIEEHLDDEIEKSISYLRESLEKLTGGDEYR